jgi:tetratricopeptide (TPR) repeat protein
MEDEKTMNIFIGNRRKNEIGKKCLIRPFFLLALACLLFVFGTEAHANGNVSADEVVSPQSQVNKSVRKAPVKKPAQKTRKKQIKPVPPRPVPVPARPSSLEVGVSLMDAKRYGQARPWLQKAVQEERRNPYAWYWYGMAHEKIGQIQQAQFFYARALDLDPAFPPFSRVVAYPDDDGDRKALWDPLRPARVYPVETTSRGMVIVPPGAQEATARPSRPAVDPMLPRVPVYVPPEPTNFVIYGDAEQPPVYVPPPFPGPRPVTGDVKP